MTQQQDADDARVEAQRIIAELDPSHIIGWSDLERTLKNASVRVRQLTKPLRVVRMFKEATPPKMMQEWSLSQRILFRAQFEFTVTRAFFWDVLFHPGRNSYIVIDRNTKSVWVEMC